MAKIKRCPTCGQKIYQKRPTKSRKCVVCGKEFRQGGPGRPRLVCRRKRCAKRRHDEVRGRE